MPSDQRQESSSPLNVPSAVGNEHVGRTSIGYQYQRVSIIGRTNGRKSALRTYWQAAMVNCDVPVGPIPGSQYGGPALSSLELVDYPETILPYNALRSLTSLRSLTVHYRYIRDGLDCRLASWLAPLMRLETLSIVGETPFGLPSSANGKLASR